MTAYDAKLQIEGEATEPLPVTVDLTGDRLIMIVGDEAVADWSKDEMRISALPDGFHIRAEGESIVLDVTDDAKFAVELGLRNAHPDLRQRMAALIRNEDRTD